MKRIGFDSRWWTPRAGSGWLAPVLRAGRGRARTSRRSLGTAVYLLAVLLPLTIGACGGRTVDEESLDVLVDSLLPRLEELSGLEAREPVNVALRDRAQLRDYVTRRLEEELTPEEMEGIEATYRALGLFPDTLDLRRLMLELYTEQVSGYYDPKLRTLYVMEGVSPEDFRPVLVHELVHALQDQHTNLDSLVAKERGNDRQTAAQAALEGHATLVMFAWLAEQQAGHDVAIDELPDFGAILGPALEAQNDNFPVFRSAPRIIRETMLFSYLKGASFVQALWRAEANGGRPAPIGHWLPSSTEQVLHPGARFIAERDEPTEIMLEETPSAERAGAWRAVYENTLGELEAGILLSEHLGPGADSIARGWDGDRYRLLATPAGGHVLVWYSVWDDDAAADRFAGAYRRILSARAAERQGTVERLSLDGRPVVRVVDADRGVPLADVPVPGVARLSAGRP